MLAQACALVPPDANGQAPVICGTLPWNSYPRAIGELLTRSLIRRGAARPL